MKRRNSRSRWFNVRRLFGFVLCSVAVFLMLGALGAMPLSSDNNPKTDGSVGWLSRFVSRFHRSEIPNNADAESAQDKRRTGAASMVSANSVGPSAPGNVAVREPVDPIVADKIRQYRNPVGQTVYSISPSGFDISPPLTKLAKLPPTVPDTIGARPELPFPSWRIPHSDQPDPVVQVAPSAQGRKGGPAPAAPTTGFNFLGQIGGSSFPPDTNGSVGNDQYVETVNTTYQVWTLNRVNSTVTSLAGPSNINTLWSGLLGGNCSTRNEGGHMPADLDGFAPPPGSAPGIFVSIHTAGMYLYRMKVDFATPANTTRTLQAVMPTASAAAACGGGACIPQPGSSVVIDSLADRLMFRLAYRNFIDHESLVISHSVDPGITGVVSGVRWYDFRISGQPDAVCSSYPCTYQQGTVADVANGRSRWMPSISMDGAENILVGYSASGLINGTDNHSIRYTGRAKSDPLGTMTGPETIIFTGTRNIVNTMTNPERWGDYTSVSIDPADDCTFWHANEYYLSGGSTGSGNANWKTRIASARFPAGAGAGQCAATTCTTRPSSAPTILSASAIAPNQIQITWSGISPTPGSYAIERALGAAGSEGLYQPLASVSGTSSSFTDTTVQGGLTYTYRVLAATDPAGKCQALVRSGKVSATATGSCNLKPPFG